MTASTRTGRSSPPPRRRWTRKPRARSISAIAWVSRSRCWPPSSAGPGRASIALINEVRARRILETKLEFIPHASFDDPAAAAQILAPMPAPADGKAPRRPKAPKGLPPYLASLYEVPLLDREQEAAPVPQDELPQVPGPASSARPSTRRGPRPPTSTRSSELQEEALAVKNQIIRANLRLVVSIAKRHVGPSNNFFELVSDGNMSLIRAVEKFDFSRGNKFSTYASWAIMKNFARTIPEENYRRDRFVTGHEEMFEAAADNRTDEHEYESSLKRMQEAVKGMLDRLDDRERLIITSRFGLGGASRADPRAARPASWASPRNASARSSPAASTSSARSPASRSSSCRCCERCRYDGPGKIEMELPEALIERLPDCLHWSPDGEIRVVGHRIGLYSRD